MSHHKNARALEGSGRGSGAPGPRGVLEGSVPVCLRVFWAGDFQGFRSCSRGLQGASRGFQGGPGGLGATWMAQNGQKVKFLIQFTPKRFSDRFLRPVPPSGPSGRLLEPPGGLWKGPGQAPLGSPKRAGNFGAF